MEQRLTNTEVSYLKCSLIHINLLNFKNWYFKCNPELNVVTLETWEKLQNFDSSTTEIKKSRSHAYLNKKYSFKKYRGMEV
jgi:hypothetical protein